MPQGLTRDRPCRPPARVRDQVRTALLPSSPADGLRPVPSLPSGSADGGGPSAAGRGARHLRRSDRDFEALSPLRRRRAPASKAVRVPGLRPRRACGRERGDQYRGRTLSVPGRAPPLTLPPESPPGGPQHRRRRRAARGTARAPRRPRLRGRRDLSACPDPGRSPVAYAFPSTAWLITVSAMSLEYSPTRRIDSAMYPTATAGPAGRERAMV